MEQKTHCIICNALFRGKQTKFCSLIRKNKHHQGYISQQHRGLTRKRELVFAKGGHCSLCGYRKNLAAFAFHHLDSTAKDFKLNMRSLSNRKMESVLVEFHKCILVCHNCHAEIHNPFLNVDSLS